MARLIKLICLFVVACNASPVDLPDNGTLEDEEPSSKIVGGTRAAKNEFPYQLSMLVRRRLGGQGMCGATILNEKWAMSAAHCFEGTTRPGDVTLRAGYTNLKTATGGEYDVRGSRIVIHPQYNPRSQANDIALIQISGTFRNTAGSMRVKLPQQGERPTGDTIATGWGTTKENGQTSDDLLKVTLPVLDDSKCRTTYPNTYNATIQMCAGVLEGGKDTCQGDSGGPLALNGVQLGITSYGAGCARNNTPGVYTRVSFYRNYIRAITGA